MISPKSDTWMSTQKKIDSVAELKNLRQDVTKLIQSFEQLSFNLRRPYQA